MKCDKGKLNVKKITFKFFLIKDVELVVVTQKSKFKKKIHTKRTKIIPTLFNEPNEQRMRESKCIELYRLAGRKKCEKNYTITEIKSGGDDDDC